MRRSPNPGALIANALNVPRSLFTTNVARASPSTSSAMITNSFPCCTTFSSTGKISAIAEILRSVIKMYGSLNTAYIISVSVTMYGDIYQR